MDCEQVKELLDAYALGAVSEDEAKAIEEHVADCVGCWEELQAAQRTAALLPLSMPITPAPERLGEKIMASAQRDSNKGAVASLSAWFANLKVGWPAATATFGTAAAAVLVFAVFTQTEVNDLQGENDQLEAQVVATDESIGDIVRVATASDVMTTSMAAPGRTQPATTDPPAGEYRWSSSEGLGVLFCRNLPQLADDEVFQAWYQTADETVSVGTFESRDGDCHFLVQPVTLEGPPTGVGVSREKYPGSSKPTGIWLIFAKLLGGN